MLNPLAPADAEHQARALEGEPFTAYVLHEEYGCIIEQGHLGYTTTSHLTYTSDRTHRGLPPEVSRIMLANLIGLHRTPEEAIRAHDASSGDSFTGGPLAGTEILSADAPPECGGDVTHLKVQPAGGAPVSLWAPAHALLAVEQGSQR